MDPLVEHPFQVSAQLRELPIGDLERHIDIHCSIELYGNSGLAQGEGDDLTTSVVIKTVVPLDGRRTWKLEAATEENIGRATVFLVHARWVRVESHLKNLAIDSVSTANVDGIKGESRTLHFVPNATDLRCRAVARRVRQQPARRWPAFAAAPGSTGFSFCGSLEAVDFLSQ